MALNLKEKQSSRKPRNNSQRPKSQGPRKFQRDNRPGRSSGPRKFQKNKPQFKKKFNKSQKPRKQFDKSEENVIYIGEKPVSQYFLTVKLLFYKKNYKTVIIRSRGRHIAKAVDLAEITKRIIGDIKSTKVEISSESFSANDKKVTVSSIEIELSR